MDLFEILKPKKVLVIGDFMLDVYTMGTVKRISPEAPVPVLCVEQEARRPGGAGNAVLNLVSLGMQVTAVGRVGKDVAGQNFLNGLLEEGVDSSGILVDSSFHTPLKSRMLADNQQLLRVDYERTAPLPEKVEKKILKLLPKLLDGIAVIAISDYAKGFLTKTLLNAVIAFGKERCIPIIVDPKGMDFTKYKGVTVLKPNLSEAIAASGLGHEASLDAIGAKLVKELKIESLMVTRSKEGISLFNQRRKRMDFPAHVHEVRDVTGAGDTVLAVVTSALANSIDLAIAARLANSAASIAIESVGCARISLEALSHRFQKHLAKEQL